MSAARPPRPRRLRSWILAILAGSFTLAGVVALILLFTDSAVGGAVRVLIGVGAILATFGPAAVAAAYRWVRARNRRLESRPSTGPISDRAVRAQALLGAASQRLHVSRRPEDHARAVWSDQFRIAESTVRGLSPGDLLEFLWVARPSQPDDFATTPEFGGLPRPVQDAIVLLDLRREVQLRGAEIALGAASGFYHHDRHRTLAAAQRAGNAELIAELQAPRPRSDALIAALDEHRTWDVLLCQ